MTSVMDRPTGVINTCLRIGTMSEDAIGRVRDLESVTKTLPQLAVTTEHLFHAGMYARTIMVPADYVLTSVFIKIPTMLIVNGDALVYTGDGHLELTGHNVVAASAGRKQVFVTRTDTHITMIFPTSAESIEQAESEFTDEVDLLMSRRGTGLTLISED